MNSERKYCVYCHTNKINHKAYIGITYKSPQERWGKCGYHYKKNKHFWGSIQKYGWDNFEHVVLFENLTKEQACQIEILLIALFNTRNPDYGYNISFGGELGMTGCHMSEESKKKMSESKKGMYAGEKNPMYGVSPKDRMDEATYLKWKQKLIDMTTSDETRQKRRDKNLGKKYSDDVNKKKGRRGAEHPMYGKHHSDVTKEKLRQANLGKHESEETRQKKKEAMTGEVLEKMKINQPNRVQIMCVETGQAFISISEASRKLGISTKQIRKSINNEYKYNVQKYNFIIVDREEDVENVKNFVV